MSDIVSDSSRADRGALGAGASIKSMTVAEFAEALEHVWSMNGEPDLPVNAMSHARRQIGTLFNTTGPHLTLAVDNDILAQHGT